VSESDEREIEVEVERPARSGDAAPAAPKPHPNTCPSCRSHYRDDELREALRVCPACGHHFPVGALERIEQLADPDSFRETATDLRSADPLAFVDLRPYVERLSEAEAATGLDDAMVVGSAELEGRPIVLAVMDFAFMGGSMGSVVGEKFARACDLAVGLDVPLVSVAASGGARMQENVLALMQMAKTVGGVDAVQSAGLPFVSVLAHPTTGGVMASFAALGDVIIAEPGALMSFAGPRVVQQTVRERLPPDFGRAESNFQFGQVDLVVPRGELRAVLARLLRLFADSDGEVVQTAFGAEPADGLLGRVLRRLRRSLPIEATTNGGVG
jgi:acetyl-CoA carboxylase carboxyl transferase subunit beta